MCGMMGGMEKTTVYLTSRQKAALAQAAQAEGRSEAALIRAGIDAMVFRHIVAEAPPGESVALVDSPRDERPPGRRRPRWIDRASFVAFVGRTQADAGLRQDLEALAPGTTADERSLD